MAEKQTRKKTQKKTQNRSIKISIPRLNFIDAEIAAGTASGKYPSTEYLAEEYGVDVQTIWRDIKYMKGKRIGAPIKKDTKKNGWYYTDKTFRIPALVISENDLLAVELVNELMELYRDTPIHGKVDSLLKTISKPIDDDGNSKWYKDRIIVPKTITVPVDPKVWQCITAGLKENRVIKFNYLKGNSRNLTKNSKEEKSKESKRTVQPYQLMFDRSAWYLLAYDEDKEDKRIFYVSRISDISVTDKTFKLGKDFDYRAFNGGTYFGIFSGKDVYKFEIEIFGDTHWLTEIKLAEDQNVKETKTGAIISFTSNQLEKVLDWILVQGTGARPVKPKILVDNWRKTIKEMADLAWV